MESVKINTYNGIAIAIMTKICITLLHEASLLRSIKDGGNGGGGCLFNAVGAEGSDEMPSQAIETEFTLHLLGVASFASRDAGKELVTVLRVASRPAERNATATFHRPLEHRQ